MKKTILYEIHEDLSPGEYDTELGWELAPGESLIWRGQPGSRFDLVRRTLPTMLVGVLLIGWSLFWIWATHIEAQRTPNCRSGLLVGLFVLVNGLSMVFLPVRIWWKARKTRYFLTNQRAIICEPTLFGGYRASSYAAAALALMHREGFGNDTGDLIFGDEKSRFGGVCRRGFLAIEQVREVEALVRITLLDTRPLHRATDIGPGDDPEFRPMVAASKVDDRKVYRLPTLHQTVAIFMLAFCAIGTPILIVGIGFMLIEPGLLAWMRTANSTVQGLIPLFIFGVCVSGLLTLCFIRVPYEIALKKDATIELRSWRRTIELRPEEILSIQTGGWKDPDRVQFHLRHKGGHLVLPNEYSDFREFLVALKSLNPSVEIKGF